MFIRKLLLTLCLIFLLNKQIKTQDLCQNEDFTTKELNSFHNLVHLNALPLDEGKAGNYTIDKKAKTLLECLKSCCMDNTCTSIWMNSNICYLISCKSVKSCSPNYRAKKGNILVNVRDPDCKPACEHGKVCMNGECQYRVRSCEVGLTDECNENEECLSSNSRKRNGMCVCSDGFRRNNETNKCLKESAFSNQESAKATKLIENKNSMTISFHKMTTVSPPQTAISSKNVKIPTVKPDIVVSAGEDQRIVLPENKATLSAYAFPTSNDYTYLWKLVKSPAEKSGGVMDGVDAPQLHVTQLKEGSYTFKIKVSSSDGRYGEATVNVTVVKSKTDKEAEAEKIVAIIRPPNLKVQLPNSIVLDGTGSEGPIKSFEWSLVSRPLQAEQILTGTSQPILRLNSPNPGKYVFKLTVKALNGYTASAKANVTVLKETDNAPTALVKDSVVLVSLPNDSVTLNADSSFDDHGIISYEWTQKAGNTVDVKGSRTPHLTLTRLTAGQFVFTVKVTDTAGQSNEKDVNVIVTEKKNSPPEAVAGNDVTVFLPVTTVTLDASKSKDDEGIKSYTWSKINGDESVKLKNADRPVATAENLKEGTYEFQVVVEDQKGLSSLASVKVYVKRANNKKPIAVLPDDMELFLPVSLLSIDGRKSSDDKDIAKWQWKKTGTSLAAVRILNNSDSSPVLLLTDFIPGKYMFELEITDTEGLTSSATIGIVVKPDPNEKNMLEAVIDSSIETFTSVQFDQLEKRIALLLKVEATGAPKVIVREIKRPQSGKGLKVIFSVKSASGKYLPGASTAEMLRKAVLSGRGAVLDWQIFELDTVICQNNCSNHGRCDLSTKHCVCDAFWMPNLFKRAELGRRYADCDWSVLYVIVVTATSSLFVVAVFWASICVCRRRKSLANAWKRRKRSPTKYSLLQDEEESIKMVPTKNDESEFSSDEDTLFVSHKMRKNKNTAQSNGHAGHVRRVKT